jgi:Rieske Fe-S protein
MPLNRRHLFATAGFAALSGAAAVALRFLWPQDAEPPPVTRIASGEVPSMAVDPLPIQVGGTRAYVVALPGSDPIALRRTCTREGCTVAWRERVHGLGRTFENVFRCPCCGSAFATDGSPVFGPAPSPLERLVVEQHSDGDVFVSLPGATAHQPAVPR